MNPHQHRHQHEAGSIISPGWSESQPLPSTLCHKLLPMPSNETSIIKDTTHLKKLRKELLLLLVDKSFEEIITHEICVPEFYIADLLKKMNKPILCDMYVRSERDFGKFSEFLTNMKLEFAIIGQLFSYMEEKEDALF